MPARPPPPQPPPPPPVDGPTDRPAGPADGRFAPSPSGPLHLGNLRTALLAWLFARSAGSRFLIRMEDLDTERLRVEHYEGQLADLAALGLDWDGPVVRQSDRLEIHRAAIHSLDAAGLTYDCFCTRREIHEAASAPHGEAPDGAYVGTCLTLTTRQRAAHEAAGRRPALRLRAGGIRVAFEDRLHGHYEGLVDDVVIRRNDGTPAYNLAVVVDDAAQGIREVVRGDDLLSSTPRQLHLADLLGQRRPAHAHVPLVVSSDGSRLAKRHGAVTLGDRRALGESPAEVAGRLTASLGLTPAGEPVDARGLRALADRFVPTALPLDPWVFRP